MDYTPLFTNLTTTTTTGTSTTMTATSVATQTTIYVQVRAENGDWSSPYSSTVSGTVGPCELVGLSATSSQTLTAVADTGINQAAPTQNNGSAANLFVQSASGSGNRRSLVRFDLPTMPTGCTVTAATLSLYNQSPTPARVIEVSAAATSWTEDAVTWNTQPATTGTAATSITVVGAGAQSWTVTSLVQAQYSGSNNGFVLRDRTENAAVSSNQIYRSRESGSNPPQLVITFC
jgi:hypothetical protein